MIMTPKKRGGRMDVILLKDVPRLGEAGHLCKVASGYARNYLIPQGFAVPATEAALNELEQRRQAEARRQEQLEQEAQRLAAGLEGLSLTLQAKTGETDRLYGSITSRDIAEALEAETGIGIERRKIELEEPIRELGEYTVPIRLATDVSTWVTVEVVALEEQEGEKDRSSDEKD
jgi:large subunit ribosomal protein L9